ncbi:MAG: metallophosphoesterase family protein [Bacteroidales bacterium]|nr:metallophosphoesterase family protein [Bacteroidales bacterium]
MKNWEKWFRNMPEDPYSVLTVPEQILLSIGDSDTSRAFTWRCDTIVQNSWVTLVRENTNDTLYYKASGVIVGTPGGKGVYYGCLIDSLKKGENYRYSVTTAGKQSDWFSFYMPEQTDSRFSFIYLGDIQDSIHGKTGDIYHMLAKNYPDTHFWLFGGDMVERYLEEYWTEWFNAMDTIASQVPILSIPGNHEHYKGFPKKLDPRWTAHFRYPENGIDETSRYGNVRNYGDVLLVSLTTFEFPSPVVLWQQYWWLDNILRNTRQPWKIVTMHHPVYSIAKSRFNPFSRWIFNPLFEKYNVDLVLQGHDHGYGRRTRMEDGKAIPPLYIVTCCSPKTYVPSLDSPFDRMASGIKLYQQIRLNGDTLFYTSYTTDDRQLYDSVLIIKDKERVIIEPDIINTPEIFEMPTRLLYKEEKDRIKFKEQIRKRQEKQHT